MFVTNVSLVITLKLFDVKLPAASFKDRMFAVRMDKGSHLQLSSSPILYVFWLFLCLPTVRGQDGKVTCSVPPVEEFHDTVLTCHFPEDLSVSKKDFTVYHYVPDNHPVEVLACWWIKGVRNCSTHQDFVYNNIVSRTLSITARHVTTNHTGSYACQIANYDASFLEKCELSLKPVSEHSKEETSSQLMIILISSLLSAVVVSAFVILLLRFRRKLSSIFYQRRRRQRPHDEHKSETEIMLEKEEVQTQKFQCYLEEKVREMYPDLLSSCYCVPPIYFNKCRYKKETVITKSVLVYESCDSSEVQYDRAMHHVLHCLRHVGEQRREPMFVLTQFRYKDYLNTVPKTHARHSVRRVKKEDENLKCFDLLIIHRKFGFTAVVVKTVSDSPGNKQRDQQTTDETLTAQCKEAISQLKEAGNMINVLMSDEPKGPEVRLVLILPNLSSSSIVPEVTSQADTIQLMYADDLPDFKSTFDVGTEQKLGRWFDRLIEITRGDTMMSDELYLKAISRFCGPATQSKLESEDDLLLPKTLVEAVLITGKLYKRNILHPNMLDLLKEERLILVGPPNTGKPRMLMLAAEKWQASDLHVISGKRTQNNFVKQQLRAHHIECDFNNKREVEETARMLCEKKNHNTLCVLAYDVSGQHFQQFCTLLKVKHPVICMWATARIMKNKQVPSGWRLATLTHALTCPPAVVRAAVGAGYTIPGADNEYLDYLPPTDGPPVKYFRHKRDQGNVSHNCTQCGENVAEFLQLLIRTYGNSASTSPDGVSAASARVSTESLSSTIQDKDVLVLFECDQEQGESFLTGLRNAGITVHTFKDKEDMNDFTEDNKSACAMHIEQLERYRTQRKIVVYVESKSWNGDRYTKWRGITSCTSQLIVVSKNFR